jgi:5-methylcytosine-specific restriction endonuclease McrA
VPPLRLRLLSRRTRSGSRLLFDALQPAACAKRSESGSSGDCCGVVLLAIAERDGWCCHLCGRKVADRIDYAARDDDATLDHLVPVSKGGLHVRANVALAHNRCNWERGNADIEFQMRLIA